MANESLDEIRQRITIELTDSLEKIRVFREQVNEAKRLLKELADASGESFDTVAKSGAIAFKNFDSSVIRSAVSELKTEMKETSDATNVLSSSFGNLGNVANFVFGSVLGVTAIGILRSIIGFLKEAAQAGLEFTASLFKMEVAVRAARRGGLDITLEDVNEKMNQLAETFGTFSRQQLTESIGTLILMSKEFGLAKEQMFEVADAAAALSLLFGKDLSEASRQIGLAISSGYSEALQRAGINISKVAIQQEGLRLGINKTYIAMTGAEKATAVLSLVTGQLSDLYPDLARYLETTAGQARRTGTAFENLKTTVGTRLAPIVAVFNKGLENVYIGLDAIANLIATIVMKNLADLATGLIGIGVAATMMWKNLTGQGDYSLDDLEKALDEIKRQTDEYFKQQFFPGEGGGILGEDIPLGTPGTEEFETIVAQAVNELTKILETETERLADSLREAEIDLMEDLAEIDRRGNDKRLDAWEDYLRDIDKLNRDYQEDVAKAARKYEFDRQEILSDIEEKIREKRKDQRDEELEEESKLLEKLRRLRENFLLDLEEAVRKRDASQIRTITRQYNLRRAQTLREGEQDKQDRQKDFEDEIQELEDQRKRKLEELRKEYEFRLNEFRIQLEREAAERKIKYQQELDDLQLSIDRQKREREISYKEQVAQARRASFDRVEEVQKGLERELGLTEEYMKAIYDELGKYYGENGLFLELYKNFYDTIGSTIITAPGAQGSGIPIYIPQFAGDFATGGAAIASKPTSLTFGEGGEKEIATVTPWSDFMDMVRGSRGGTVPREDSVKVSLEVFLSDGLEAELIDSAMSEVANVIVDLSKSQARRR